MLGVLIVLCFFAGLVLSVLTGKAGLALYRNNLPEASWLPFWLIAIAVALLVIGIGVTYLHGARHSPPRAEDFYAVMKALFLFGAGPGAGMLAGGVYALFR
jgi:hypothetical protein